MKHSLKPVILALFVALIAPAFAQTNSDNATLQALLTEVRQLRLVVEKSISLTPRMQLLLQRVQFQEQKVARISQQLDEVRKQIAGETARQANANERLATIDQDISAEPDAEQRKHLESIRAALKVVAANGPDQQIRAQESEISNSMLTEQALLDDLNSRLDAIERQLPR